MARIVDVQRGMNSRISGVKPSQLSRHFDPWRGDLRSGDYDSKGTGLPDCCEPWTSDVDAAMAIDMILSLQFRAYSLSRFVLRCPARVHGVTRQRISSLDRELLIWRALLRATEFRCT